MCEYHVAIVADPNFGEKLKPLAERMHVWTCMSPGNEPFIRSIWQSDSDKDSDSGVSTFPFNPNKSPEEFVSESLDTIDMHHNEYSHEIAWTHLEVYGASLTPEVRIAFESFGISTFLEMPDGFVGKRAIKDR